MVTPGCLSGLSAVAVVSDLLKLGDDFDPACRAAHLAPSQTLLLHTALLAHGVDSTRYVLDGADHGELAVLLGDPEGALPWSTQELLGRIVGFLDKELGR